MGGRGAASGISDKGRKYGTEYHSVLKKDNIKFVKYNYSSSAKTPMETMTKKRIYATINNKNEIRAITLYGKNGKRVAQIDITGRTHKINGKATLPHTHIGYFHDEHGTRKINDYEKGLIAKVKRIWDNRDK
ncbi:hypothetical protein [Ligilactobacillus salivarius]|uniref:hypothetical protein n=1 Tax=Ligilactobacillus salivarius TaxID=1624 RepID=UPI0029665965|nr:hypothetical protein [Ligilactobacillus salivarius]MDW3023125.1 hypothetical protein [Ligilactobacillus salivarius]